MAANVDSGSARRFVAETLHDDAATLPAASDGAPEPGARVGRYLLLERIGMGGMGIVYAAYDPDLDRRVALKLLRGRTVENRADLRLLREARALAKLSHPNVVPVFDVGTAAGRTFVAMEYVEGLTLTRWLAAQPRTRAEILRVFVAAGRGLVAAHTLGIVHRDFKPDNVLLGADDRVCVGDFGLARAVTGSVAGTSSEIPAPGSAADDPLDPTRLTHVGVVLGTPAYMAPEQHRGEDVTPASDQYAFCVALFEALFGTRPFAATTARALVHDKTHERIVIPPNDRGVPAWLRATIVRGLAAHPEARWPDLSTLLDRLEHGPSRRKLVVAAIVLGTGALAAVAWPAAMEPCDDDTRLAAVWNPARRDEAHTAFTDTRLGYAEASWKRTEVLVDAYAQAWTDLRRETCIAATTGARVEPDRIDSRTRCLDDRLAALDALVAVLVDADTALIQHAVTTAAALPSLVACLDPEADTIDLDPTRAAERQSIGRGLTRVMVLENAGRYHAARSEAELLLARAQRLGDPHILAAAHQELGSALHRSGEYVAAREHLHEGVFLGTEAGEDITVANAALDLIWLEGVDHSDSETALEWARHAGAAIDREGHVQGRAQLANALGAVYTIRGRHADALVQFERARELFATLGDAMRVDVGTAHQNIGIALGAEGRHREGLAQLEQALAIYEEFHGPDHPETANTLDAIAGEMMHLGELDGARSRFERALAMRAESLPEGHPDLARSHNNLGSLFAARRDHANAELHFRRALAMFAASFGEEHPYFGATSANLADVQYHRGDHEDSQRTLQRALAILQTQLPADHPFVLQTLAWLARSDARLGQHADAARHAAPVLAACEVGGGDPTMCGHARFAQARVDRAAGDREHARALAEQAVLELRSAGAIAEVDVDEVQQWLDANDGARER